MLARHLRQFSLSSGASSAYVLPKPSISNAYLEDAFLQAYLQRILPADVYAKAVKPDLINFGKRVVTDIWDAALKCEREQPELISQDCWGKRKNQLLVSSAWDFMKETSAREGLIAIAYERKFGWASRVYQTAKLWLFQPSSGFYCCPLAATDGAARAMEAILPHYDFLKQPFANVTSRDPKRFWSSGQWMTEKRGGSDVANSTETIAIPTDTSGVYRLYGTKFFTSVAEADMTLALARVATDARGGGLIPGNKGLAMFYLETRLPGSTEPFSNGLQLIRLKDKLGTRQLATAEMQLNGAVARQISGVGRGIAAIAEMLYVTRLFSAVTNGTALRRCLLFARNYASNRDAFGQKLINLPLYTAVMVQLEIEARVLCILCLRMAELLGRSESEVVTPAENSILRLLMPVCKGFVCRRSMPALSEAIELFGGQGYMEDSGIPMLMRDAQVNPIWEGSTNIQALDVLRALANSDGSAVEYLLADSERLSADTPHGKMLVEDFRQLVKSVPQLAKSDLASVDVTARDLMFGLGAIYAACLLADFAKFTGKGCDLEVVERWIEANRQEWLNLPQRLAGKFYSPSRSDLLRKIVMEGDA